MLQLNNDVKNKVCQHGKENKIRRYKNEQKYFKAIKLTYLKTDHPKNKLTKS